jgi:hypothetical protein
MSLVCSPKGIGPLVLKPNRARSPQARRVEAQEFIEEDAAVRVASAFRHELRSTRPRTRYYDTKYQVQSIEPPPGGADARFVASEWNREVKRTLRMRRRLSELDQANEFPGSARVGRSDGAHDLRKASLLRSQRNRDKFVRKANSNCRLPILQGSLSKRGMQERSGSSRSAASRATPISPL